MCHFGGSCLRDASTLGAPVLCQRRPCAAILRLNNGRIPFPRLREAPPVVQRALGASQDHTPLLRSPAPGEPLPPQRPSRSHLPAQPIRIPRTSNTPKATGRGHGSPGARGRAQHGAKGEAAAPRKTAKLGGWERSEELLSNRGTAQAGPGTARQAQPSPLQPRGCSRGGSGRRAL